MWCWVPCDGWFPSAAHYYPVRMASLGLMHTLFNLNCYLQSPSNWMFLIDVMHKLKISGRWERKTTRPSWGSTILHTTSSTRATISAINQHLSQLSINAQWLSTLIILDTFGAIRVEEAFKYLMSVYQAGGSPWGLLMSINLSSSIWQWGHESHVQLNTNYCITGSCAHGIGDLHLLNSASNSQYIHKKQTTGSPRLDNMHAPNREEQTPKIWRIYPQYLQSTYR